MQSTAQPKMLSEGNDFCISNTRWQAHLSLYLCLTKRGSVLKNTSHQGPLYVQKAFYPEGRELAHLYILHPPGGLVSGDKLLIKVLADEGVKVLLTTPGAGRVYRARADQLLQQQIVTLEAMPNACIEWLPLETILYPGANTRLDTHVKLARGASFIGWDICTFGLPACGQTFSSGSLTQCLQIEIEGTVALRERLVLNDKNRFILSAKAGLDNRPVNALLVAGPFNRDTDQHELLAELQQCCVNHLASEVDNLAIENALSSITLNGEFIQVRYLGHCSEQSRTLFIQCWAIIRPALLGRPACPPRIWAT